MALQGWCLVQPSRRQSKEPSSMGSRRPLHAVWTDRALQPACLFTVGGCRAPAVGGACVWAPEHGLQGPFGPAGGFQLQWREKKSYIRRAENIKRGLVISRQSSIRPFPALASCSGSCLGPGSRISCYKTLISPRCAQNSARAGQRKESQLSHDRQAGAEEYMGGW